MAEFLDITLEGFAALNTDLGRATVAVVVAERAVVERSLQNIKAETRKAISTNPQWGKLRRTVNYALAGLSGVVGYDDVGQGELAGIAEFGSSRHAPHPALMPAARAEQPKFEKAALAAAAAIIGRAL